MRTDNSLDACKVATVEQLLRVGLEAKETRKAELQNKQILKFTGRLTQNRNVNSVVLKSV